MQSHSTCGTYACVTRPGVSYAAAELTIFPLAPNLRLLQSALMYGYILSALRWTRRMGKYS